MNWYIDVLKKYAVFNGRARRKEFWMFVLINLIVSIALSVVDGIIGTTTATGMGILSLIYALGVLLPSIGVSIRRLHDSGKSGWLLLLAFIPLIGVIILIVLYVLDSTPGDNKYGPNPKVSAAA